MYFTGAINPSLKCVRIDRTHCISQVSSWSVILKGPVMVLLYYLLVTFVLSPGNIIPIWWRKQTCLELVSHVDLSQFKGPRLGTPALSPIHIIATWWSRQSCLTDLLLSLWVRSFSLSGAADPTLLKEPTVSCVSPRILLVEIYSYFTRFSLSCACKSEGGRFFWDFFFLGGGTIFLVLISYPRPSVS